VCRASEGLVTNNKSNGNTKVCGDWLGLVG